MMRTRRSSFQKTAGVKVFPPGHSPAPPLPCRCEKLPSQTQPRPPLFTYRALAAAQHIYAEQLLKLGVIDEVLLTATRYTAAK